MPQMSPMNWLMLSYISFIISMIIMTFSSFEYINSSMKNNTIMMMFMKWMW